MESQIIVAVAVGICIAEIAFRKIMMIKRNKALKLFFKEVEELLAKMVEAVEKEKPHF